MHPYKTSIINKKNLHKHLDKPVYALLCKCAHHHSGIMDVSIRLTDYAGNLLQRNGYNYVDVLLSEALSIWEANVQSEGIANAYTAFCEHILNALAEIYDFTVTGTSYGAPQKHIWDCLSCGLNEWQAKTNIIPETIIVECNPVEHGLHKQYRGFLLAHHVLSRADLIHLGLANEQHLKLSMGALR